MASPLSSLPPGFVLETPPDSARPARPKAPAPPPGFVLEQQPPTFETVPSVPLRRQQETAPPPGFVLKQAKEPAPRDNSSWLTDLQIGWENLKGSFATSDFLQSQEDLASATKPFPAARGAPRPPTPLEVAQRLAAARKKEAKSLGAMAETQSALKNLPQSPAAQAFSKAETFGDAWNAMLADPWAVSRSTVLQSAPASIPSVVGGIAGSFLGPAGSAMGAGYGSYLTEIGGAIQEGLQQKGANLSDPESIASTWARHKDEIAQYAQTRAGIIGAADAATAGLSSKIGLTAPAKQWIKGELKRGILGTGVEAAGGMAGEAGAQLATTGELKPGQVLAEGLGEVVPGAIQVAGQTAVGTMAGNQVDGQPPPPSAPPPPRSRTEPRLFPDQPPGSQAGPATPPPQQAAPQADQPAPAPSAPSAPPAPPPGFVLEDAPPSGIDPGDEGYLLGAGYTPEQIADMNVPERTAAAQEARQQGVTPVTPSAAPPPPGTAPRAPRGTRQAKATIETAQDLEPVRPVVNPEPSEAQARAGNYQKAHVRIHGLDVSIENPRGSIRRGRDEDGRDWASPELPADYGYIKRTTGKDGDHVDVYIGPSPESDRVFVIDQLDLKTGKFDEHKSVLGASSLGQAVDLYVNSFDNPTLKRIGDVTEMSVDEFRQWVKEGRNTKRPAAKAGIGTVTPNPPEAPSQITEPPSQITEPPSQAQSAITGTPDAMQAASQMPVAAPQQDAPRYNPTTISGEVDDALKRYLGGTGPLTPEAFAKFAKIDVSEAGKALQYAGLRGGLIIDKNGNWRRPRTFKGPANVLDFIASIGGIRDVTGEIRGMDLPKMTQFGPVVRKKGLHPDRVREQLIEAGYLFEPGRGTDRQQQTTVADVYDLISQQMSGLQVVAAEDQAEADAIRVQKLNENMPDDWQPQNQVRARFGAEVWSDIEDFFARSETTEESWGPDELRNAARLIAGGMEPDDAFERAAIQYHATLEDTEGLDPALEAAFQNGNPNVMVAFEDVPFPDLETATNADQQQGPQEAGDGAGPAGADRLNGAGQAVDADTAEEVRSPSARGGQEGGRGQDAGPVSAAAEPGADGRPQLVIPGAEQDVRGAMQNAAKAPLKSKSPQKGMDIGMFGSERDQTDIFDKRPEEVASQPPTQTAASTKQQEAPENKDGAAEATPAQSLKSKSKKKESVKIDDFGEKILGARKDAVRSIVESLTAELDAESATVRQAFPQPSYEELAKAGVDKKAMALVALMRDVIPSKPHKKWKLKNWLAQLNTLRGFSGKLLNGDITTDEVMKRLAESSAPLRSLADTVGVVAALPPNLIPFGARFRIHEGTFFVWKGVKRTPPLRTYYLKDEEGRQTDVDSQNLEDIQQIAAGYIQVKASKSEDKKAGRRTPINLYRDRKNNSIYLGFEGLSRQVIRLKSDFQSIQDARQYLADHADDLQRQIDDMREGGAVRRAANMPRKGENRRQGDVTPEQFSDTFGFRGVQFGNYVEDDRRQSDLNETYDALMDMADILGVPPLSLSLNGELGLAFGARGHGGKYAAHYEPLQVVINLTKNRGAGSLAHEWLHAVDHYFNRQSGAGKNRGFISESRNQGDLREPVWIAWKAVEKAVEKGPFHNRAVEMDKAKSKPYWSTTIEKAARAFERYIVARLEDKGANNDYLANLDLDSPAYPTADELEGGGIRKAFDDLFSAIEIRWSPDRKQAALSSRPPQGTAETVPENYSFAASVMRTLAQNDDMMQAPRSDAVSIEKVVAEIEPDAEYSGQSALSDAARFSAGAISKKAFRNEDGNQFFVIEDADGQVWLDISDYAPGLRGNAVYSAVANYAHNTGKVFIGDPAGISADALVRRTEAMLSTALKFGTTRHIEPHPRQMRGEPQLGIPALRWTYGNDPFNVASLIRASTANINGKIPEVANARFDFETGTFRNAEGKQISDEMLDGWISQLAGVRRARAGRSTIKRAILLNTLLRAESSERPGLLEQALRFVREEIPVALRGTLYSQPSSPVLNSFRFAISDRQSRELTAEINQIAQRILGRRLAAVNVTRSLPGDEDAYFDPNTGVIYIALQSVLDPRFNIRHEAVHALRQAGVMSQQEWAVLSRMAKTRWIEEYGIRERYGDLYRERFDIAPDQLEELMVEEAIADAMAQHAMKPPADDVVSRIFQRVRQFLRAVANMLAGRGFTTPEQILSTIETGGMAQRRPGMGQDRGFLVPQRQESRQSPLSSRAPLSPPRNPGPGTFEAPAEERVTRALFDSTDTLLNRIRRGASAFMTGTRRNLQDVEIDLLRTQQAIERSSGQLPQSLNAYLAASLYPGRAAQRDQNLMKDIIEPLVQDIAARGLTLEQVDDFVMARHAPERNREVGKLHAPGTQFHEAMTNPAIVGGSGLSDDQANAIISQARNAGIMADLDAIGDKIVQINNQTLDSLYAEGLITQEQHSALKAKYKFYVPLRGWDNVISEDHPDAPRTGRKYDIRGKEMQAALGRTSKADSPLAYTIMQARQAIVRTEKNRVGKRFLRLAQANPNPAFWEVNRRDMRRVIDKNTGYVRNAYDPGSTLAENVYAVKVGGKTYHITLHHQGLLGAMKGIGGENMGSIAGAFHKINRYFAAINTSYDPEFIFRNFLRDLQQTGIVLQEEKIPGLTRSVIASLPKAAAGMNAMLQGDMTSDWAKYAREYADAGGKIGFMDRNDIEAEKKNLETLMSQATAGRAGQMWLDVKRHSLERLARWNDTVENTLRLATYVALRNAGATQEKAAFAARELTVNFNRKGKYSPYINAGYLFFNASTQGAASLFMRLARSKTIRAVAGGIMVEAFLMDMLNRMIAGDDDDDKNRYDKIDSEIKNKNHIFMMPKWFEEKYGIPYFKVPLPLGWNFFHVTGTQASSAVAGTVSPLEAFGNIAWGFADAFNPLGSGSPLNMAAPTLLDPAIDIARNQDYFGENIVPRQFDETTPYAQRHKDNVSPWAKWMTDNLSALTGGSPERAGSIDVSPEWVEHLWDFATGGIGRLVTRTSSTIQSWQDAAEIEATKVPFARVFVGRDSRYADRDEYYRIRDAVHVTEKELRARTAEGNSEAAAQVRQKYDREIRMIGMVDAAEKRMAKLRKMQKATKNALGMGEEARKNRLERISQEMDAIQFRIRSKWNEFGKAAEQ